MGDSRWLKRPYERADENIVVSLWLLSHARSRHAARHKSRDSDGYWRQHADIVVGLLDRATCMVLADPGASGVVLAFACWSPDVVHYAAVKGRFAEWREAMLEDLIGDLFNLPMRYSYPIPHMRAPSTWIEDQHCLHGILSQPTAKRSTFLRGSHG